MLGAGQGRAFGAPASDEGELGDRAICARRDGAADRHGARRRVERRPRGQAPVRLEQIRRRVDLPVLMDAPVRQPVSPVSSWLVAWQEASADVMTVNAGFLAKPLLSRYPLIWLFGPNRLAVLLY